LKYSFINLNLIRSSNYIISSFHKKWQIQRSFPQDHIFFRETDILLGVVHRLWCKGKVHPRTDHEV